jgi:hypothetical protein
MIREKGSFKGTVHIVLRDVLGTIKDERTFPNLVVDTGLGFIISRMEDASASVMSHIAVGTSGTAAAAGDTTLGTELTRVALTSTTTLDEDITYVANFGAGIGTGALQEAGIFNAGVSGTMLARTTFAVINKGASDTLQITWTISASA